ncbi:hypothetical protein ACIQJX_09365 [Streptomyces griseoviridis]
MEPEDRPVGRDEAARTPAAPAPRGRVLWHRGWGVCAVLLGVVLLAAAGVGLAVVPASVAEERAFRSALPCGVATLDDCLRPVTATVSGTEIRDHPKNPRYDLHLTGAPAAPRSLPMGGADPLLRHLRAGDEVVVTRWRDYAPAVTKDGVTQSTDDTPEGRSLFTTAGSLALAALGLFAFRAGQSAVTRARAFATEGVPPRLLLRGVQAAGAALLAVPAGLFGVWTGPLGVIVLWLPAVALLLLATRDLDTPQPN